MNAQQILPDVLDILLVQPDRVSVMIGEEEKKDRAIETLNARVSTGSVEIDESHRGDLRGSRGRSVKERSYLKKKK
jgi:hypothetical protein